MNKMEKDNIMLIVVIILLVSQIGVFLYFDNANKDLRLELNSVESGLKEKIDESSEKTQEELAKKQEEINKLTANVIKTQENLDAQKKDINELKASVSEDFSGIIEDVIVSVVSVRTDSSQGSGFIIADEGYIVTNYHVVSDANSIEILLNDENTKEANLIGYDSDMDIALLKISGSYDYLELDDSDDVEVGEKVIAVGNPYGLSFSVTEGIVSALDREGDNGVTAYIQTDVPLNPGNSGGPLINKQGKVIGVNNFKIKESESLGFALESNKVKEVVNEIAEDELGNTIL